MELDILCIKCLNSFVVVVRDKSVFVIVEIGKTVCTTGYLKSAFLWAQGLYMITVEELKELLNYDAETGLFTWNVNRSNRTRRGMLAGSTRKDGYSVIDINKRKYKAHRLAWMFVYGCFPEGVIDHQDGNPSNNSIKNLRSVTAQENTKNQSIRSDNKTGLTGVHINKKLNKYQVQVRIFGKPIHLGIFDNLLDAAASRKSADIKYSFHINHGRNQANQRAERQAYGA